MSNMRRGVDSFDPPSGMVRIGTIVGYNPNTNVMQVQLTETPALKGKSLPIPVPAYFPHADSNGLFVGSIPAKGTTVTLAQSSGGQYYIVNHQLEDLGNIPTSLSEGILLFHASDTSQLLLDIQGHIKLGSDTEHIHIFAGSQQYPKSNLITLNFENENHFNQAYREIGGLVKRDLRPNPQASSYTGDTKLEDDSYDTIFSIVGMDPTATSNDLAAGPTKNPPFVEHRQIVYEFQYQSNIDDDIKESNKYSATSQSSTIYTTTNRRSSRADTMSLSLVAPNFLIEEVKGTVIDIFANILDINRTPIPVGLSANTTFRTNGTTATTNAQQSFNNVRALERKSVAYHFEINARKDPNPLQGIDLSINADNYNAKLQRSRFSFDIDKEGLFKLNVPASSNIGNIPLLTRAENYSTFGTTDSSNPNQTWFMPTSNNTSQDIYLDSFAAAMTSPSSSDAGFSTQFPHGSIQLIDGSTGSDQGPVDRISQFVDNNSYNIRHGTAHHDILEACILQRSPGVLGYPTGAVSNVDVGYLTTDAPTNAAVANSKITVAGAGANAGGRSGSINLDGSLEMNIGANTVDRQSLWLDTAGGIVANVGRDLQQRSLMLDMDGHAFIQIGGFGVSGDARFSSQMNGNITNGILDIRIINGNFTHLIRVDEQGIVIMSPGRIGIHAGQGLSLTSDGDMEIDCETLTIQQRAVKKVFGGSI